MNGTGQIARPRAWLLFPLRHLRSRPRVRGGDVQRRGRRRVPEAIITRLLTDVDVRGLLPAPVEVAAARRCLVDAHRGLLAPRHGRGNGARWALAHGLPGWQATSPGACATEPPAIHLGEQVMRTEAPFAAADWAWLMAVAAAWGSSFLFIRIGVGHFAPQLVALLRLAFGAAALAAVPAARRSVPRADWPAIALLGAVWMAGPFLLFAVAEQSIDSSLAGMLNAAAPLFTAVVAALISGRLPGGPRRAGLLIGFGGVMVISWPSLHGAHATAAAIGLVVLATALYGIAFNLAAPLQQRHGALPVIWRAQLAALAPVAPLGLADIPRSTFAWSSLLAVAALGCLGTAFAFVAFTTLAGRVGSTRASVTVYFLPPVAIVLGAVFRSETITLVSLAGTALVTAGAYLASRREGGTGSRPGSRLPGRSARAGQAEARSAVPPGAREGRHAGTSARGASDASRPAVS